MNWFKIDPIPCPWAPVEVKAQPQKRKLPDNVHFLAGQAFVGTRVSEYEFEDVRVTASRDARLQKGEAERFGLNPIKYAELKAMWATGLTAVKAVRMIKKPGYGLRTLEKYWAAFNTENNPQ